MRVLQILASSGWGGTEKAFVELAAALAPRCEVIAAIPPDAVYAPRLADAGVPIRPLRAGSRRNPLALAHLRRIVREVAPDVVHTHAAKATEMAYWVGWITPLRHVATKHNTRRDRIFGHARWVTAVSEAARASIGGRRDVAVVHNAVDVEPRPRRPDPDVFTVLAVGRLHRHKGFDALVRALATLPGAWALDVAGEGPERPELEALVRRLGLDGRVRLLGHRDDVADLMARAHVQVVSSRTEGFSLALVEGLLCCEVVVSTPVGVAGEILPAELLVGLDGLADRLADVRARPGHYAELTARARAGVGDRFRPERATADYLEVYRRALAG